VYALPFTTRHLPAAASGVEKVGQAELAWAAATVGTNPAAIPFIGRPMLELLWRISLIRSSLKPGAAGWARTRSYDRLDPSEKTAVSYFIGGVHAKVMTQRLFGVAHLVHHDAFPGAATTGSRPDFLGMNARLGLNGIAVEAKGRSGPLKAGVVASALKQAAAVRTIAGVGLTRPIAAVSYHSTTGRWKSHLEGSPSTLKRRLVLTTVPGVLGYYYLPLVSALAPLVSRTEPDAPWFGGYLPGVDCHVWIPWFTIDAFRGVPPGGDGIELAGLRIAAALIELGYLTERWDLLDDGVIANERGQRANLLEPAEQLAPPPESPNLFQGLDFVRVGVGDSWLASAGIDL
jgi:hypothetical protein